MQTFNQNEQSFLRQAYRNNWLKYLDLLENPNKNGWDVCVLTASDDRQAAMYQQQLDWRQAAGFLPQQTRFMVMADPQGQRIGSGGATLRVLSQLEALDQEAFLNQRMLILHSGGDSKRLPHASVTGKLFARIPRVLPDGRASTVFEEFLISLSGLSIELPLGVLVASGDVLLVFDHLQLSFNQPGIIGVAAVADVEMGTHHGVYVKKPSSRQVKTYLHKVSQETLAQHQAIEANQTVLIDTGLIWFDALTIQGLNKLAKEEAVKSLWQGEQPSTVGSLNLYGDLLLPLAEATDFDEYLADTSNGPASPEIQAARRLIWEEVRDLSFSMTQLQPAVFIHFGTSYEYWQMVAADESLATLCDWQKNTASWSAKETDHLTLVNAYLVESSADFDKPVFIADSFIGQKLSCAGRTMVIGLETSSPLNLRHDCVLHQLPLRDGYITRLYGLHDDPKHLFNSSQATFLNLAWSAWLEALDINPDLLWPNIPSTERCLWNAKLYPFVKNREESLQLVLPLLLSKQATSDWRQMWQEAPRLSLQESFALANGKDILDDISTLRDRIIARRFYEAVVEEQPADEVASLFGGTLLEKTRRIDLLNDWFGQADPILQWRAYKALAVVTGQLQWEDKAFFGLAQTIETAKRAHKPEYTLTASAKPGQKVRVAAAARIDFGGGWTDTPPYSIERGGKVLNAAVTLKGDYPIIAEATWLKEPNLVLDSKDIEISLEPAQLGEVLDHANPADPFALVKAALVLRGIVPLHSDPNRLTKEYFQSLGWGIRLSTQTKIPRGSGLGTSSIIAGAVLSALAQLLEVDLTENQLFDEVLCLEQMLTTGGGWQDQVGGLVGGVKLVTTKAGLPQQIQVHPLALSPETQTLLNERLVLIYTGQQRLAKNLLRNVMGRWMARDPEMVWILQEISGLAEAMQSALLENNIDQFGMLLGEHWTLNKRMDPGCTNPFIDDLFEAITPYVCGGKLAGAGGGGFGFVVTRDEEAAQDLSDFMAKEYTGTGAEVWECSIPQLGLVETN